MRVRLLHLDDWMLMAMGSLSAATAMMLALAGPMLSASPTRSVVETSHAATPHNAVRTIIEGSCRSKGLIRVVAKQSQASKTTLRAVFDNVEPGSHWVVHMTGVRSGGHGPVHRREFHVAAQNHEHFAVIASFKQMAVPVFTVTAKADPSRLCRVELQPKRPAAAAGLCPGEKSLDVSVVKGVVRSALSGTRPDASHRINVSLHNEATGITYLVSLTKASDPDGVLRTRNPMGSHGRLRYAAIGPHGHKCLMKFTFRAPSSVPGV
jgi:hypothetical protein